MNHSFYLLILASMIACSPKTPASVKTATEEVVYEHLPDTTISDSISDILIGTWQVIAFEEQTGQSHQFHPYDEKLILTITQDSIFQVHDTTTQSFAYFYKNNTITTLDANKNIHSKNHIEKVNKDEVIILTRNDKEDIRILIRRK